MVVPVLAYFTATWAFESEETLVQVTYELCELGHCITKPISSSQTGIVILPTSKDRERNDIMLSLNKSLVVGGSA